MDLLHEIGSVISNFLMLFFILVFLAVAGNMLRGNKGQKGGGSTYSGIIDRRASDPLALHIWDFLNEDRCWGIEAPNPRVIDRSALAGLDQVLAATGMPLTVPRSDTSPAVAYLTERFGDLLPKGWRVVVSQGGDGIQVRLATGGAPEFASTYNPAADVSAVSLYDLCQSHLFGVGARSRRPGDAPPVEQTGA